MDRFAASEHFDVVGQLAVPGVRTLGGVESVDNGVAVSCVQLGEGRSCRWTGRQRVDEIGRDLRVGLPQVGRLPLTLGLGRVDGRKSSWLHPSCSGETGNMLYVALGP